MGLLSPQSPHHGATRARPSKFSTNLTIAATTLTPKAIDILRCTRITACRHHACCCCCQVQLLLTVELLLLAQRGILEGSVQGGQSAPMTTLQLPFSM